MGEASRGEDREGLQQDVSGTVLSKAGDKILASAAWASWLVRRPTRRAARLSIPKSHQAIRVFC